MVKKNKNMPNPKLRRTIVENSIMLHPVLRDMHSLSEKDRQNQQLTLKVRWTTEAAEFIQRFLETRDFAFISQCLKAHPHLLGSPIIFHQLFHMRNLLDWGDEDFETGVTGPLVRGQTELLEPGVKHVVRNLLLDIFSAWIERMLPGYTVCPIETPPKRGRNEKLTRFERWKLLGEFNEFMDHLEAMEAEGELERKRNDTAEQFCRRIAEVVQQLHLRSDYSLDWEVPEPTWPGCDKTSALDAVMNFNRARMKDSVSLAIARGAIGKKYKVQQSLVVYQLLAHHHPGVRTAEAIRGYIERASIEFPELDRHRLKRSRSRQ